MTDPPIHRFPSSDGLELAYRDIGNGRPIVLLHGFTSTGLQWIHHGPATTIAEHGYRVIFRICAATVTARDRTIRRSTRLMSWPTTDSP